jgi:hypothetical protein
MFVPDRTFRNANGVTEGLGSARDGRRGSTTGALRSTKIRELIFPRSGKNQPKSTKNTTCWEAANPNESPARCSAPGRPIATAPEPRRQHPGDVALRPHPLAAPRSPVSSRWSPPGARFRRRWGRVLRGSARLHGLAAAVVSSRAIRARCRPGDFRFSPAAPSRFLHAAQPKQTSSGECFPRPFKPIDHLRAARSFSHVWNG